VGQRRDVVEWREAGAARVQSVAERVRTQGWRGARSGGFAHRVFQLAFFQGLSGIAYTFLRVAMPDAFPSVLGFEAVGVDGGGEE
jgi:lantibiotic modifying enzyme